MGKYRYFKGSRDSREAIDFDVKKNGQYITTCVVTVYLLLAGVTEFPCGNGNDIKLTPKQRLEILELLQAERKKITDSYPVKTYKGWEESGLPSFEEYCFPGDEVDEAVIDHFVNSVPPVTLLASCTQAGEACSTELDDNGKHRDTYTTFHRIEGGRWVYDGQCFKGSNDNKAVKPYCQLRLEKLIEEARREADSDNI